MAIEFKLQQLFREPIERIIYLDPGYSGHASDVCHDYPNTAERIFHWRERCVEPGSRHR